MRVGYFTMPLHPPGADPGGTMADDLDQLVFLDRLGFEEAWIAVTRPPARPGRGLPRAEPRA
jgi:hypothetical protein